VLLRSYVVGPCDREKVQPEFRIQDPLTRSFEADAAALLNPKRPGRVDVDEGDRNVGRRLLKGEKELKLIQA